ncbi:MAG: hypothetical protein KDA89_02080 [Planctomycetaceae bacterium]|nr:hypothetical protein [Planctomycetaceae bacterium]
MQHHEWAAEVKRLLKSKNATPADWDVLLSQTDAARRSSVNDWHVQQTSGNYADYLRQSDDLEAAARIDQRIADDAEECIRYWHTAAGSSLAQAALDQFKLGNKQQAVSLAKRAISHFGHTADPSSIYETLISTLRNHLQDAG